jgi:hypothetical protein
MSRYTWFNAYNYTVGIDLSLDGLIIANVLSAAFDIPLGTVARYEDNTLIVGTLTFNEIPKPRDTVRRNWIYA